MMDRKKFGNSLALDLLSVKLNKLQGRAPSASGGGGVKYDWSALPTPAAQSPQLEQFLGGCASHMDSPLDIFLECGSSVDFSMTKCFR